MSDAADDAEVAEHEDRELTVLVPALQPATPKASTLEQQIVAPPQLSSAGGAARQTAHRKWQVPQHLAMETFLSFGDLPVLPRSAGTTLFSCGDCSRESSRVGSLTRLVARTAPPTRSSSRRTARAFCRRSRHCRCGVRFGPARARQSTGRRHPIASALAAASVSASRAAAKAPSAFTTANFATRSRPP